MQEKSSEEARRAFRRILDDAMRGEATVITRHGEGIAVVMPISEYAKVTESDNGRQP